MNSKLKSFVLSFIPTVDPVVTVGDFMKNNRTGMSWYSIKMEENHEKWKKCNCGNEEDLRQTWHCSSCGAVLFTPKQK
ncbi:hypothetical protein EG346_15790 [Chryseobacterium carnipullorum]|uniref:Uncharacterized protein n=1 Tax=Chryseobacterium carnipullorum TaxID=1124835 RepID=A0A3G6NF50_CHRCU|nr:hypothetical protein [Chryseobacterium carnipullorum]AZA49548.1 hypothetical protein EG346_15790 [Chryseobacterium carnipullorum]AZA64445.1 hypothetical protein EG345_06805 [Chryseobacterium carnipullorum]